jgi:hypothetical protein
MPVVIRFDPGKLQSCRRAILQLCAVIEDHHSPTVLRHLVVGAIPLDGRDLQLANNDRLLVKYMRSGLSIRKCAAMLAEKNKSLPPDLRYGPTGTTNAETLEKQIRRLKKRKNFLRRKLIEAVRMRFLRMRTHRS